MSEVPPPAPSRRAFALRVLVLASILLAVVTGALALSQPASTGPAPSTVLDVHQALGAVLGLLLLGVLVGCLVLRREHPRALPWSAASFALVVVMGGIGQGLFSGALPVYFVLVQTGLLALLLVVLVVLLARLWPRPTAPTLGEPSERAEASP